MVFWLKKVFVKSLTHVFLLCFKFPAFPAKFGLSRFDSRRERLHAPINLTLFLVEIQAKKVWNNSWNFFCNLRSSEWVTLPVFNFSLRKIPFLPLNCRLFCVGIDYGSTVGSLAKYGWSVLTLSLQDVSQCKLQKTPSPKLISLKIPESFFLPNIS